MPKKQEEQDEEASQNSESTSDSHLCCCLCYCAVDYSDKEAFYGYQQDDCENAQDKPRLLPKHLFDAQNALVLCDSCDRPYHQRCHFVPVITLPRGDWHCLLCKQPQQHEATKRQTPKKQSLDAVYPFPPKDEDGNVLVDVTRQQEWEFDSRHVKAVAWKREFARFQRALSLQLQNIRLAQDTIRSHTTSSRKSHCMINPLKSQELCQCVVRLTTAKLRIRQWFSSLEKVRQSWDGDWTAVQDFLQHYPEETKTWFPYGKDLERRIIPRCGHSAGTDDEAESGVPAEVVVNDATKKNINTEDNDDMISLDDLQCCICFRGDASDENDVLLCDGQGCFRAFHMKCVSPHVSPQEVENEDDDWFCPICTAMAKLLANVQSEYTGDEWQVEEDASTIRSWDHANDVFPEAEQEYEMAIKWKEGQHDDEMAEFMSNLLGITIENGGDSNTGGDSHEEEADDDDSEDEDFDLDAFKNRKRDDDEESDVSSKATLQDMSDVEAKIDRKELDALSLPSEDSSDEDEGGEGARRRTRSARSSCVNSANNSSDDDSSSTRPDVGTLDESNIIVGKRRRNQVDYRRLNDSMFGDISEGEAASIDDNDEFEAKIPSRRNSSSDSSSSSEDEDSSPKEKTSGSESDTNESSVDKNKQARRASKNKTTVNEGDSDSSRANATAKRRTTRGKSKQAAEKKDRRKRQASKKSSAENESDSDSSKAKANRRTKRGKSKQGKSKQGKKGATESSVEKKRVNRASKNETTVNESDSDSSKVIRRTTRGNKAKKGKNGAKTAVAKPPPKSRKRNATRQDVSSESSSDESNPKAIAINTGSRKPKTPTANGEKLVNGQKKRRSKRAKWES